MSLFQQKQIVCSGLQRIKHNKRRSFDNSDDFESSLTKFYLIYSQSDKH